MTEVGQEKLPPPLPDRVRGERNASVTVIEL
ncbi:uncharacterized protein METZ01_LOCUS99498 [marine metagenome]|uniref:Uncharacterized protein n=1 Tax=marine metagenome TaxID=408172 RepID=A0A381W2E2_9ZZZZ